MSTKYAIRISIKAAIHERGFTIADVARAAGLSYACLSAVLNGRACPSPRVMEAMAAVLGESSDALFRDNPDSAGCGSAHLKPMAPAAKAKR